jgi:hypothetical protein
VEGRNVAVDSIELSSRCTFSLYKAGGRVDWLILPLLWLGVILLFAVPIAAVIGLLVWLTRPRRSTPRHDRPPGPP